MANYQGVKLKLINTQLNKMKFGAKNKTNIIKNTQEKLLR